MTAHSTYESPDAASATLKPLRLAALTVWIGGEPRTLRAGELDPDSPQAEAVRAAHATGPAWLDLQLDTNVQQWLQPWEPIGAEQMDLRPVASALAALGLEPPGVGGSRHGRLILSHLHEINEYGVLRWLTARAHPEADAALVMPLVGFIPGDCLELRAGAEAVGGLEFALLRVNVAVIGDWLVTVRLTDRLCSGCRERSSGQRLAAGDFYEPPDLALFNRFLPTAGLPTPTDLADAVAGSLAATCSTAAEFGRERLREVERRFVEAAQEGEDDSAIAECHTEILAIRATLESVGEELLRLSQRLSDVEHPHPALSRARPRYDDALRQLDSVEAEIRWASDAATNQLTSQRLVEERVAEQRTRERQKTIEKVIAGLGTALVIAALVPSLFRETAKLPNPDHTGDFVGMVLIMFGLSGVVFWALVWLLSMTSATNGQEQRGQLRWGTLAAGLNLAAGLTILAGVLVLFVY